MRQPRHGGTRLFVSYDASLRAESLLPLRGARRQVGVGRNAYGLAPHGVLPYTLPTSSTMRRKVVKVATSSIVEGRSNGHKASRY
jgi:hypothetical protein